jgi:hypothetical protein
MSGDKTARWQDGRNSLPLLGPPSSVFRLPSPDRRTILRAGAAALALGAVRLRFPAAAGAQDAASPTADVCVLTPELTEGPYYLPLDLLRGDITEGKPGLPLRLRVAVVDLAGGDCVPLSDAAVDIWHCDAQGYYSGVAGSPGGGANPVEAAGAESGTFLRGIQLTNADGMAEFMTIYPGWYQGRTVHIHLKVHVGGSTEVLEVATPAGETPPSSGDSSPSQGETLYGGGHVAHTGQIFFDDTTSDEVFEQAGAYAGRDNGQRLRNDQDSILGDHAAEPGFMVALTPEGKGFLENGFVGAITIGVDASATPAAADVGGGPPPNSAPPPDANS